MSGPDTTVQRTLLRVVNSRESGMTIDLPLDEVLDLILSALQFDDPWVALPVWNGRSSRVRYVWLDKIVSVEGIGGV